MTIFGIIAEYNPFHNGHRFHIQKTREAGATHVVAVLSPSVVQRGDVAVLPLQERAKAAVEGGADLVLELPPQWALSPARDFARAGVDVLRRLGCVDALSFGAETPDTTALAAALDKIGSSELEVKKLMSAGKTYPQAVSEACGCETAEIISGQNNTLAIEYLRALRGTGIRPEAVRRTVPHDGEADGDFAPASHIRKILKEIDDLGRAGCMSTKKEGLEEARRYLGYMPIINELSFLENGERAVLWRLSEMSRADFAKTPYCGELAGRLFEASRRAASLGELFSAVKSRNFTHARVRRVTLLAALGITLEDMFPPPFARVVALNERGAEVLAKCRKTAEIPLSASLADLSRLSPEAERQAEIIEHASRFQGLCMRQVGGASEFRRRMEKGF